MRRSGCSAAREHVSQAAPCKCFAGSSAVGVPGDAAPFSCGLSVNVNSEAEVRLHGTKWKAVARHAPHFLQIIGVFILRREVIARKMNEECS